MGALIASRKVLARLFATSALFSAGISKAEITPQFSGDWIILSDRTTCSMTGQYTGELSAMVVIRPEDRMVVLGFTHPRWGPVRDVQSVSLRVQMLPGGGGWEGDAIAINDADDQHAIVSIVVEQDDFARHWRKAIGFVLRSGEEEIGRYTLEGSAAAFDATIACANRQWSQAQADRAKLATALKEAEGAKLKKAAGGVPVPILTPASWIGPDDFPSAALREDRQGVVGYSIDVGTDGIPVTCAVTTSSGHADLDETTCTLLMRRARFYPARDHSGAAVRSIYSARVNWAVP